MDLKKLAPWNWFKKEEEQHSPPIGIQKSGELMHHNPVAQFHRDIDRLFDGFFRSFGSLIPAAGRDFSPGNSDGWLRPTLDISAADHEYTVSVELPGIDENDVQLELSDDTLLIRGEKKHEKEEKERDYYRIERSYGSFRRVLSLPEDANQDGISAAFKKGILTITIPRKPVATAKIKQIEVKKH